MDRSRLTPRRPGTAQGAWPADAPDTGAAVGGGTKPGRGRASQLSCTRRRAGRGGSLRTAARLAALSWTVGWGAGATAVGEGAFGRANQAAFEAVQALRTVHSYNLQSRVGAAYDALVAAPVARMCRSGLTSGVVFGLSNFILFAFFALAFWCTPLSARWCPRACPPCVGQPIVFHTGNGGYLRMRRTLHVTVSTPNRHSPRLYCADGRRVAVADAAQSGHTLVPAPRLI